MKGMYSGNEDWLSRQRWIPIVLVAVAVIGGWAVGSQRKQGVADKDSQQVQPMVQKRQAPKQAAPEPGAVGAAAPPPAVGAKVTRVSVVQSQPATGPAGSAATVTGKGGKSLSDPATRTKQYKACLELAKDNPSIICK